MVKSAYRSEDDQRALYARFVKAYGRDVAATLAAPPGTSEHQTGLALDVGLVGLPDDQVFGGTPASRWVADNAHRFGFILRYPPAKAAITGYANEPWHLRYVGVDLATVLHDNGLTMEEQFGVARGAADADPRTAASAAIGQVVLGLVVRVVPGRRSSAVAGRRRARAGGCPRRRCRGGRRPATGGRRRRWRRAGPTSAGCSAARSVDSAGIGDHVVELVRPASPALATWSFQRPARTASRSFIR